MTTKKPRDNQRKRFYNFEGSLFGGEEFFESLRLLDCQVLAGHAARLFGLAGPEVYDGRGRRRAGGGRFGIALPRWSRNKWTVLHETAHYIAAHLFDPNTIAGHGPEFVRIYMILIHDHTGWRYSFLEAAARGHNLKVADVEVIAQAARPYLDSEALRFAFSGAIYDEAGQRRGRGLRPSWGQPDALHAARG